MLGLHLVLMKLHMQFQLVVIKTIELVTLNILLSVDVHLLDLAPVTITGGENACNSTMAYTYIYEILTSKLALETWN